MLPYNVSTSWADDHIAISGIKGIGGQWGIDSDEFGTRHAITEWGYPDLGIVVCECPSAGHDAVMLNYSKCGKNGEPEVIHVAVEPQRITLLADNFEDFIRGLVNEKVYDTSGEDLKVDLEKIESGTFSDTLQGLLENEKGIDLGTTIRKICKELTNEKGHFSLHADTLSYLLYDIQFWLFSRYRKVKDRDSYLKVYPAMIVLGNGDFNTGGYAPGFVKDWFDKRVSEGQISKKAYGELKFTKVHEEKLMEKLKKYE